MLKMCAQNTGLRASDRITKTQMHDEAKAFMEENKVLFFNDVKNNLITLSSLGFWDDKTMTITSKGLWFSKMTFHDFLHSFS